MININFHLFNKNIQIIYPRKFKELFFYGFNILNCSIGYCILIGRKLGIYIIKDYKKEGS